MSTTTRIDIAGLTSEAKSLLVLNISALTTEALEQYFNTSARSCDTAVNAAIQNEIRRRKYWSDLGRRS